MEAIQCIAENKVARFKDLVVGGVDIAASKEDSQSLLHWAATFNQTAMMAALLEHGISPNILCTNGTTALHISTQEKDSACVRLLLEHGADCDIIASDGPLKGKSPRDLDTTSILDGVKKKKKKIQVGAQNDVITVHAEKNLDARPSLDHHEPKQISHIHTEARVETKFETCNPAKYLKIC